MSRPSDSDDSIVTRLVAASAGPVVACFVALAVLTAAGCGDDGDGAEDREALAPLRPFAYVMTECSVDAEGETASQRLVVRHPGGDEITLADFLDLPTTPPLGLCQAFGEIAYGNASKLALPFQRLGVSPDGETVVFEVTDEHSLLAGLVDVPDEEEGIFVARSDGTGLRRLGLASRDPDFRFAPDPSAPGGIVANVGNGGVSFSPNGRMIAFTDLGPGPGGEEAVQVVTLDLSSGERTQVTRLPRIETPRPQDRPIQGVRFVDDTNIGFVIISAGEELSQFATVGTDGSGELTIVEPPIALPGAAIVPEFSITAGGKQVLSFALEGTPVNPGLFFGRIVEPFVFDGTNLLQLTNFRRTDTALSSNRLLSRDGRRAFFSSSANPLGTNPRENCQYFSVDVAGGDLRQLTNFGGDETSTYGCDPNGGLAGGCTMLMLGSERDTDTAVFYSTCDPFGTNPAGGQIFRMQLDGSGLRQLTTARGMESPAPGTVTVELPGPIAYPESF